LTSPEDTALIGTLLNDRYEILSRLGEGGMGVVYRANDTLIRREVAIKATLNVSLGAGGQERLLKEARAAGALNHPNIVTIHDVGAAEGRTFIVMEFVEGHTLQAHNVYTITETVGVAKQICAALAHAHEQNIIHRELKPENVMILPDGTLKLMDFGLARSLTSRLTEEGQLVGTVLYMPPEQVMGEPLDGRADLYALGVMLYEMTTGRLPFQADTPVAIISQHLDTPPVPPKAHRDDLPDFLNNLIVKLLEKDPEMRFESAVAVLELLESPQRAEMGSSRDRELTGLDRFVRGRIVGRQAEYEKAQTLWRLAVGGRAQTLLISGEPGIGKTRLTREVVAQAEVGRGRTYIGETYAESNIPYGPFAQIIRAIFKLNPDITAQLARPLLADLIKLAPTLQQVYRDIEPNPQLDPEPEQALLFEHMVAFCEVLSQGSPLLIVLDDTHWADSGTLAMFHHLIRRTRDKAIMFLATYRDVELHDALPFSELLLELDRQRIGKRLRLEPLSQEQAREMLAAILQDNITDGFLSSIYQATEGNPLFIEEICRALVDTGELRLEDGEWRHPIIEEMEISQGIQAAVDSRLLKLDIQVQDVLRMAAVMGREFEFDILLLAMNLEEEPLVDALETAEDAQMIQEVRGRSVMVKMTVHLPGNEVGRIFAKRAANPPVTKFLGRFFRLHSLVDQYKDHQKGADLIQQAVDLAEQNNLWREAIRAHTNYAHYVGEDNKALQRKHFARAFELARMMGLTDLELSIWTGAVSWAVWMAEIRYGLQELPKIKERLKKTIDPEVRLGLLGYIEGDILRFQGDLESALPKYQRALETHSVIGLRPTLRAAQRRISCAQGNCWDKPWPYLKISAQAAMLRG
jgi:predicted Ser/Thr protein kinase/tetratricopeptide (TPR) repeat protein